MNYAIFLLFCNYLGTIAFAISGVLKGIRHRLDVLGLTLLAIITACGGGIIRDLLVNEIPDALVNPESLYLSIFTAGIIFIFTSKIRKNIKISNIKKKKIYKILNIINLISDSIGLSIFAIIGAEKSVNLEMNIITTGILAALTGVGGGIIRDLLVNEIPIVLKEDIYAFLAFAIGIVYHILITELELPKINVTVILFGISLITRLIVIKYRINLPTVIRKSDNYNQNKLEKK